MATFGPSGGIPALQFYNEELDKNPSTIEQFNLLLEGETIDQFWGDSNDSYSYPDNYSDSKSNGGDLQEMFQMPLIGQELDQTISEEDENPPVLTIADPKKNFLTMLFSQVRQTLARLSMKESDFVMLTFSRVFGNDPKRDPTSFLCPPYIRKHKYKEDYRDIVFGNDLKRDPASFLCPPYIWKHKYREVYRDMYLWLKLTDEEKKDRLEEFEEDQFKLYNQEEIQQNVVKTCFQLSLSVKYVCYQVGKGKVKQLIDWKQLPNRGDKHFFRRLLNWLRLSDNEKVSQGGERRVTGKAKRVIDSRLKKNPDISREELGQIADELQIPQIVIFSYAKLTGVL